MRNPLQKTVVYYNKLKNLLESHQKIINLQYRLKSKIEDKITDDFVSNYSVYAALL